MRLTLWAIGAGTLFVSTATAAEPPLQRHEFAQNHMGVPIRLVLYAVDIQTANEAATAAFNRIEQLDRIMSDYDSESELVRLCRASGPGRPVRVSDDLYRVLNRSLELSQQSDGAFDVTVGPLVRLWRRTRRRKELPDAERLARARELVGFKLVCLHPCPKTVELLKPGMKLDLGGIAKGYACDAAIETLRDRGVTRTLIDAGGDIVVGDPPPDRRGWRIQVGTPPFLKQEGSVEADENGKPLMLSLKNASVATSGDTYQFVEIGGVRYSHIVDPRTGIALTRPSSVTVIAPDGVTADSLASALSVLGPADGLQLAEQTPSTAAFIVQKSESGTAQPHASKRFDSFRLQAMERQPELLE